MKTQKKITDMGGLVILVIFFCLYFVQIGNVSGKLCLVKDDDLTQKTPFAYETDEERDGILGQAGVMDVTSNFDFIIIWYTMTLSVVIGLTSFCCCICAVKCPKEGSGDEFSLNKCERIFFAIGGGSMIAAFIIAEAIRMTFMIIYRGSHAGQVCSGDFLEEVYGQDYQQNSDFKSAKDLYQLTEGTLIWWSSLALLTTMTFQTLNWIIMNKIMPRFMDG